MKNFSKNKIIMPKKYRKVDSTNNIARKMAKDGAREGLCIIADRQTAGRGRLGRTFLSNKGGLYFSVVLRPQLSAEDVVFITVAAAVAVAQAIEEISDEKCQIKWVNDIYIKGKKVCGILTEGEFNTDGTLKFAILGVGVNLFEPKGGFPQNLPLAASVYDKKHSFFSKKHKKSLFLAKFERSFFEFYYNLHQKAFIKEYQSRSFLTGKQITYTKDGSTNKAVVAGIDDNANLLIKNGDNIQKLSYGEIQIVGMEQLPI